MELFVTSPIVWSDIKISVITLKKYVEKTRKGEGGYFVLKYGIF